MAAAPLAPYFGLVGDEPLLHAPSKKGIAKAASALDVVFIILSRSQGKSHAPPSGGSEL
jgi:hypothetical protein